MNIKTYVVHCKSLVERRSYMETALKTNNISAEWIIDFDGNELTEEIIKSYYVHDNNLALQKVMGLWPVDQHSSRYLKDAEISLTIKHVEAIKKISNLSEEFALVLEDDCLFCENFVEVFDNLLANTPNDWDIIHVGDGFGMKPEKFENADLKNGIFKMKHPASRCSEAILIKREAAKKIQSSMCPFNLIVDWELAYQYYKHDLNVYWWNPAPITQASHKGIFTSSLR
jgi:GR25 family glycosyltransferase involved in LPS biosynthesis